MQKKLYKVELQRILVVYAEDSVEATQLAIEKEVEDIEAFPPDFYFCDTVNELGDLPSNWHSSIPLNNEDYLKATVEEILEGSHEDPDTYYPNGETVTGEREVIIDGRKNK
jgi:hypothetical protein